jgi:hypothetical protein
MNSASMYSLHMYWFVNGASTYSHRMCWLMNGASRHSRHVLIRKWRINAQPPRVEPWMVSQRADAYASIHEWCLNVRPPYVHGLYVTRTRQIKACNGRGSTVLLCPVGHAETLPSFHVLPYSNRSEFDEVSYRIKFSWNVITGTSYTALLMSTNALKITNGKKDKRKIAFSFGNKPRSYRHTNVNVLIKLHVR